jgi:hypothetical protein
MNTTELVFAPLPTRKRFIDISNKTFSKLTVLGFAGENRDTKQVRNLWHCRCDCGNICTVRADQLKYGSTTSCGCAQRAKVGAIRRTHGHCVNFNTTPEYTVWQSIVQRCCNPNHSKYADYGGRGITMCDRWRKSFLDFLSDIGPRPGRKWSIERKDNNGNYEPSNCCWAERKQQMQNTRRNRFLTFQGTTLCVTEWARRAGIAAVTLTGRLNHGWPVDLALTTPVKRRR